LAGFAIGGFLQALSFIQPENVM